MTKKLTITELTLRAIPARTDTSLPGETDSIREKRKMKNEEDKGKEKVQKYKKRTSRKRLCVVDNNIPSKKLRTSNKISPCFIIYIPAKLF